MKIKNNTFDKVIEMLCLLAIVGVTAYLVVSWPRIPEEIPMHYDFAGNIDRWGDKSELIIMPIMLWLMYGFLSAIGAFPMLWNTGVTVTEENKYRVYRTVKYMVKTLKLLVVLDFAYLTIQPLTGNNMPVWFLLVMLGLVFGDLIFWMIRLVRVK